MTESQKTLAERYGTPAQVMAALDKLAPLLEGSNRKANIALQSYQAEWDKAGKSADYKEDTLPAVEFDLLNKIGKRGWAIAAISPARLQGLDSNQVATHMLERGLAKVSDSCYAAMSVPRSQVEIAKAQADTRAAVAAKQDKDLIDKMDEALDKLAAVPSKPAPPVDIDKTVSAILLDVDEKGYDSFRIVADVPAYSSSSYVDRVLGPDVLYCELTRVCEDPAGETVAELAYSRLPEHLLKSRRDYLTNSLGSSVIRAFTCDGARSPRPIGYSVGKALILGPLVSGKSNTGVPVSERLNVPQHVIDLAHALHTTLFEG